MPTRSVLLGLALLTAGCSASKKPNDDAATDHLELSSRGNDPPPVAEFRAWAKKHAHQILLDDTAARAEDLRPFGDIVGQARVVALSEPFHGGHEPLALRNRLIRYLVTEKGFTAVTLETGLAQSKPLYDYVLGAPSISDSTLRASFTYGFGEWAENLELLRSLRAFNVARSAAQRVRLYGIDLPGQITGPASEALAPVLEYLDHADPAIGAAVHAQLADVVPRFTARRYVALSNADKDMIAAKIHDLVALIRRNRVSFTESSPRDEYEWALRQAVNAEQDLALMRLLTPAFLAAVDSLDSGRGRLPRDPRQLEARTVREAAMAENVAWVLEREGQRGRIVSFAHDAHQQGHVLDLDQRAAWAPFVAGLQPAGMFARAMFGADLVTIGTYYGRYDGPDSVAAQRPDSTGTDALFASLALPTFLADLRAIPANTRLHQWLMHSYPTRWGEQGRPLVSPLRAYDAVVYIDHISPARPAK